MIACPNPAVPSRWRDSYPARTLPASLLPDKDSAIRTLPVALPGRPQRHFYLATSLAILRSTRPMALFIEAEAFPVAAPHWAAAAHRLGIPFGVDGAEDLGRASPHPDVAYRSSLRHHVRFVAALLASYVPLVGSGAGGGSGCGFLPQEGQGSANFRLGERRGSHRSPAEGKGGLPN